MKHWCAKQTYNQTFIIKGFYDRRNKMRNIPFWTDTKIKFL